MPFSPAPSGPADAPAIVLDTNVLLDWLVFRDARSVALDAALLERRVRWIATRTMRDEWDAVLARGVGATHRPDAAAIEAAWARHVHWQPAPPAGVGLRFRCTDPADQMFIDLALQAGARWLLSNDRAVLKLARRARQVGLVIVPPQRWAPETVDVASTG